MATTSSRPRHGEWPSPTCPCRPTPRRSRLLHPQKHASRRRFALPSTEERVTMETATSRPAAICTGDIDWPAHWRTLVETREATSPASVVAGSSRWDNRAERFARMTRALDASADPFVRAVQEVLRPGDTLLDVGAGAGRYSMPLAPLVSRLTAVEPSDGMRAQFTQEATRRGFQNITLIASTWENAQVETHDVAFAANVLYFVPDAVRFVEKLDRSTRRTCLLLHRVE